MVYQIPVIPVYVLARVLARRKMNIYFIISNIYMNKISICFSFFWVIITEQIVPLPRFDSVGTWSNLETRRVCWFSAIWLVFNQSLVFRKRPYSHFQFYYTVSQSYSGKGGKLRFYAKEILWALVVWAGKLQASVIDFKVVCNFILVKTTSVVFHKVHISDTQ